MDLATRKSNSIISLCFFLMLVAHYFWPSEHRLTVWRKVEIGVWVGLYLLMVYARWKRDRTTAAWAIPLSLSAVGLVVWWVIISTNHSV
jgi:hypothetical protein